jgi:glycerophosphoryl diester phosphodiesterase
LSFERTLNAPAWLTARPIAHRGLHAEARGIIENSIAAAAAAIVKNYPIECDVQCTKDGEAVVFHDFLLDRLTPASGDIGAFTAAEVTRLTYREGGATIVALPDFLAAIGGRVPLIIEIKSRFDGDMRVAARVVSLAAAYSGPVTIMSFDPDVLVRCRTLNIACPLGLVAQAAYDEEAWQGLTEEQRKRLANLIDFPSIAADFLAWRAADLPHAVPLICRASLCIPVLAWTLRDAASCAAATQWADQVIFERFEP